MSGAEAKARRLRAESDAGRAARRRLVERVRTKSFPYRVDVLAADEVKRAGLIARYE